MTVSIHSILLGGALIAAAAMGETLQWNSAKSFKNWNQARNAEVQIQGNTLVLKSIKTDCGVYSPVLALDPGVCNRITFRYRATGTGRSGGQVFFAHSDGRFSGRKQWQTPPLKSDGQWHTVTLTEKNLRDPNSWFENGTITRLRFDPTDSAGGQIEIADFKLWQLILPGQNNEVITWNAANDFGKWQGLANVKVSRHQGLLVLSDIKKDCQIISGPLAVNPLKYNRFAVVYRATGIGKLGGELFFAHHEAQFKGQQYWQIPPLNSDGQWHTLILTPQNLNKQAKWFQEQSVTQLRLDPTNSAGGKIEIKEIKLYREGTLPSLVKLPKLPLELDEPVWPQVKPELVNRTVDLGNEPYFQGKIIASPEDIPAKNSNHVFYLRKNFELKKKLSRAYLQYIADDEATSFINGFTVGSVANWRVTSIENVTQLLKPGRNVLSFRYQNTFAVGGVMAELFLEYADGSFERINTDHTFLCSPQLSANWNKINFNDQTWTRVQTRPGPPNPPWTTKIHYVNFASPQKFLTAQATPAQAKAGQTIQLRYRFQGRCPDLPLCANLELWRNQTLLWEEKIDLKATEVRSIGNGQWELQFPYTLPLYANSAATKIRLNCTALFVKNGGFPEAALKLQRVNAIPGFTQPIFSRIIRIAGTPMFEVNGQPFYPIWGGVAARNRPDRVPRHSAAPLNLVTVYSNREAWWPQGDTFDPTELDRAAESYRRQNPEAYFMMDLSFYPPRDWEKRYPDEMARDDHGDICRDGSCCYSFASQQAARDIEKMLIKVITYLESSPYANRIIGYRINGGHTIEWLGWDPRPGRTLDFSPATKKAFKAYLQKNYPQITNYAIPTLAERKQPQSGEILWDPQAHLRVIAFNNFYSNAVVEMMLPLCRKAKKLVKNRKLIGTYYGYTATLNSSGNAQIRAHYDLKKVLDAKAVDFLMSPQSYSARVIGGTNADMKPFGTLIAHNILPVIEDDSRTHNGPFIWHSSNFQTITKYQTINLMRRNMGIALCRNVALYAYALCAGTEFDFPEMAHDFALDRVATEHVVKTGNPRSSEIAIVFSEETIKAMPELTQNLPSGTLLQYYAANGKPIRAHVVGRVQADESFRGNLTRYARLGAPADYLLAEDLADNPGNYKLYIFVNCFKADSKLWQAAAKLRQRPCTLLWVYAPGYTANGTNSLANMKKLTGLEFTQSSKPLMPAVKLSDGSYLGTPTGRITPIFAAKLTPGVQCLGKYEDGSCGLAVQKTGQATTIFCGPYKFTVPFLTRIARQAGVHIYSETSDPIEANQRFFTLHARFPGKKTVKLRNKGDILDVFNRKIIARDTDCFSFNAPLHSSWLFYCGPDAQALLDKLNQVK